MMGDSRDAWGHLMPSVLRLLANQGTELAILEIISWSVQVRVLCMSWELSMQPRGAHEQA